MTDDRKSNSSKEIYIYVLITLIIFSNLPIIFGNLMRLIIGYGFALNDKMPDYLLTVYSIIMSVVVYVYEFKTNNKMQKGIYLFLLIISGIIVLMLYYGFFSDFTAAHIKLYIKQRKGILSGILFLILIISAFCWRTSVIIREKAAEQEMETQKRMNKFKSENINYKKKIEEISSIVRNGESNKTKINLIREIIEGGEGM